MTKSPETILQEFNARVQKDLRVGGLGRLPKSNYSPKGAFNEGLLHSIEILADILEVCEKCLGTGTVEIQTRADDSIIRKCECIGEEDEYTGEE